MQESKWFSTHEIHPWVFMLNTFSSVHSSRIKKTSCPELNTKKGHTTGPHYCSMAQYSLDLGHLAANLANLRLKLKKKKPKSEINYRKRKPFEHINQLFIVDQITGWTFIIHLTILQWLWWNKFNCILPYSSKWRPWNAILQLLPLRAPRAPLHFLNTLGLNNKYIHLNQQKYISFVMPINLHFVRFFRIHSGVNAKCTFLCPCCKFDSC